MKMSRLCALFFVFCLVLTGCAATQENAKVDNQTGESAETSLFSEYKENRPKAEAVSIDNEAADTLFASIAAIYATTIDLSDSYISKVEDDKYRVVMAAEQIRKEDGEEKYQEYMSNLTAEDKEIYAQFAQEEKSTLAVSSTYLGQAMALQSAAGELDIKSIVSNPFKLPAALKGGSNALDQINYTVKSLSWLKETSDAFEASQQYTGR